MTHIWSDMWFGFFLSSVLPSSTDLLNLLHPLYAYHLFIVQPWLMLYICTYHTVQSVGQMLLSRSTFHLFFSVMSLHFSFNQFSLHQVRTSLSLLQRHPSIYRSVRLIILSSVVLLLELSKVYNNNKPNPPKYESSPSLQYTPTYLPDLFIAPLINSLFRLSSPPQVRACVRAVVSAVIDSFVASPCLWIVYSQPCYIYLSHIQSDWFSFACPLSVSDLIALFYLIWTVSKGRARRGSKDEDVLGQSASSKYHEVGRSRHKILSCSP